MWARLSYRYGHPNAYQRILGYITQPNSTQNLGKQQRACNRPFKHEEPNSWRKARGLECLHNLKQGLTHFVENYGTKSSLIFTLSIYAWSTESVFCWALWTANWSQRSFSTLPACPLIQQKLT